MSKGFVSGRHAAGDNLDPYLIAEIGVNHEGSMELAKRLIAEAAEAGAHAAKFQTYKAEKIASRHSPAYWDTSQEPTKSQFELFKKYDSFGEHEYEELADHCNRNSIDFLSTPFDLDAVEFLDRLVPAFKIASADITNVPLIRRCASKKKPLIMSTGASTFGEIEFALQTARDAGASDIALLHCVLNYPTSLENANLQMITRLADRFPDCVIGYSDHVVPDATISALEAAMLLGASVLEKHFTHDKSLPGNDHYHAMDKRDLENFRRKAVIYARLVGEQGNEPDEKNIEAEKEARLHARRSIVAARDIKAGEILTEENLIAKRPGHGISPVHWDELLGKQVLEDVAADTLITWEMLSS